GFSAAAKRTAWDAPCCSPRHDMVGTGRAHAMTELVTDGVSYWARQSPERAAIVFDGTDTVNYQTLDRWTDSAALYLASAALRPGDRVGIIGDNSLEWVVAAIGALKIGVAVVPLNNRFTADELRYLIEDSTACMVLADDAHHDLIATAAQGTS